MRKTREWGALVAVITGLAAGCASGGEGGDEPREGPRVEQLERDAGGGLAPLTDAAPPVPDGAVSLRAAPDAAPDAGGEPDGAAEDTPAAPAPDAAAAPAPGPASFACNDGLDDDGDGRLDLEDPDCRGETDTSEEGDTVEPACQNGADDDGDGRVDFPAEPGCRAAGDDDEADPPVTPACANGRDDDDDGRVDYPNDPGCAGLGDVNEADPAHAPACTNGLDDDGDDRADFPADPGCTSAAGASEAEAAACGAGHELVDLTGAVRDGGGYVGDTREGAPGFAGSCGGQGGPEVVLTYRLEEVAGAIEFTTEHPETTSPTVLYVRQDCASMRDLGCNRGAPDAPGTHVRLENPDPGLYYVVVDTGSAEGGGPFKLTVERVDAPRCRDRRDNDQDDRADLADPGCENGEDDDERDPATPPECANGVDDDGDGRTDYPADDTCAAAGGTREADAECALRDDVTLVGPEGGLFQVDTTALEDAYQATCGGQGPEAVFALRTAGPALVTATTLNNLYDTLLFARGACDDEATELGCNDDFEGVASSISFQAPEAGLYYIFVDGFGGGSGTTDVQITVQ